MQGMNNRAYNKEIQNIFKVNSSILNEERLEFWLGNFNLVEVIALSSAFTDRTEVNLLRVLAFIWKIILNYQILLDSVNLQ